MQIGQMRGHAQLHIDKSTHQYVYPETLSPGYALQPESKLQADFAKTTGIWCPKSARHQLEHLMEHHHFTVRELSVGWKGGAIGWNVEQNVLRVSPSWVEALFAYSVVIVLGLFCFGMVCLLMLPNSEPSLMARLAIYVFAIFYMGVCWMAFRFILWPRRIALRIKRMNHMSGGLHAAHLP